MVVAAASADNPAPEHSVAEGYHPHPMGNAFSLVAALLATEAEVSSDMTGEFLLAMEAEAPSAKDAEVS